MKLPESPNIGPSAGASVSPAKASAGTAPAGSTGKEAPKLVRVADTLDIGPAPKPAPQEVKLAKREVEADYRILKSIINRQIKAGDYPPLESVDRLAKMMTAGTGR